MTYATTVKTETDTKHTKRTHYRNMIHTFLWAISCDPHKSKRTRHAHLKCESSGYQIRDCMIGGGGDEP